MYSLKLFENGWKVDRKELGNRIIRFIHLIEYFAYVSREDLSIFLLEREEDVAFQRFVENILRNCPKGMQYWIG